MYINIYIYIYVLFIYFLIYLLTYSLTYCYSTDQKVYSLQTASYRKNAGRTELYLSNLMYQICKSENFVSWQLISVKLGIKSEISSKKYCSALHFMRLVP